MSQIILNKYVLVRVFFQFIISKLNSWIDIYKLSSLLWALYISIQLIMSKLSDLLWEMFESAFLNLFIKTNNIYVILRKIFFTWISKIILIYYIKENGNQNITWNYYLNYNLDKYIKGTYYIKIYDIRGINHIAYNGNLNNINKMNTAQIIENLPRRKNILLLNNGIPNSADLQLLDNYRTNMIYFQESCITNLGTILSLMGLKCDQVAIIQSYPFNKIVMKTDEIDIDYLYQ